MPQKKVTIPIVIITIIGAIFGGSQLVGDVNFGTIIGHQGDNIINNYLKEKGYDIDVETFRQQCEDGIYTDPEILNICKLV